VVIATPTSVLTADRCGQKSLLALGGLGLLMVAFVAAGPWIVRTYDYAVFVPAIVFSGAITMAAAALATSVPERWGLIVIVAMAIAMRVLAVGHDPFLSTDVYRYVWDGRVQGAGINPYAFVPANDSLASLRDTAIYSNINRADYAVTAYPPVAQMFFFAVTRVSESLMAMRLAMVACEIVVVAVLIDLLRRIHLPVTAVVAWAWHPLVIWEIANNGHADALMVALLMVGVWLLVCNRRVAGAIAVALAALVKPYAVVALPAFWRPWDWRAPAAAVATAALCYLPYAGAGSGVLGFVTTGGYLSEEGFTDGGSYWLVALVRVGIGDLPGLTIAYMILGLAVMVWLALRALSHTHEAPQQTLLHIGTLLMAALFLLSPNYPWYVLAVVPFVALGGGAPAWAMTLVTILLYKPAILPGHDLAWKTIATVPFIVAVAARLFAGRLHLHAPSGSFAMDQLRANPVRRKA
jgi:alpha-1,6-mannosyltransferase